MVWVAAAVFWIGLRRGWWVDLISYILKLINSKGKPKSKKKKKKKNNTSQKKKKARSSTAIGSEDGHEESGLVESPAAAMEAGAAASAKALFSKMKMKMKGRTEESADETAEREFCLRLHNNNSTSIEIFKASYFGELCGCLNACIGGKLFDVISLPSMVVCEMRLPISLWRLLSYDTSSAQVVIACLSVHWESGLHL